VVHVGDHQFVEKGVLNLFISLMLNSWYVWPIYPFVRANKPTSRTSATNAARVYNSCLSQPENQPDGWFSFDLRPEQVWDGFCLLSLLEDHARQHTLLTLPHDREQKYRFTEAMKVRNTRIEQAGQEEYAHICKKCQRIWPPEEGKPGHK
jgi:hypothetical protein